MRGPFRVTWVDAFIGDDEWLASESFVLEPRVMETTGWVIHQGNGYFAVAGTYDAHGGFFTQVICIPRGCILSVRDVSELGELFDGDSDLVGDSDLDSSDGDESEEVAGLHSLVGVPNRSDDFNQPDSDACQSGVTCACICHNESAGLLVRHVVPCCSRSGQLVTDSETF